MFGSDGFKPKVRLAGPNGQDILPMTPSQFDTFINTLCGTGDAKDSLMQAIKTAIDSARQLQEFNAIPTTNPKYYSLANMTVDRHCNLNVEWMPLNSEEDGGVHPGL